jgi:hypothetical protein
MTLRLGNLGLSMTLVVLMVLLGNLGLCHGLTIGLTWELLSFLVLALNRGVALNLGLVEGLALGLGKLLSLRVGGSQHLIDVVHGIAS